MPRSYHNARDIVTEFDYDELDRMSATRYEDSALDVTYGYDDCVFGTGRLCSVTEQGGRREYDYDAFGNVVEMRYVTAQASYTTRYRHDAGNRITEMVMPSGRRVTYGRDSLRRLTSVAAMVGGEPVSVLAGSDYRADGLLTGRRFGNGLDEVRAYDEQGRLERQVLSDVLDASVDQREYSYDANGNMLSRQNVSNGMDSSSPFVRNRGCARIVSANQTNRT